MTFTSVVGQAKAVRLLSRALGSGRLAHAYLFSGPDGIGKTTVATDFAAMLFCRQPKEGCPCGQCAGCLKFRAGSHPDFLRIRPDGAAIRIEQVRNLKKALLFPPLESSCRVAVLEEVHTMRREAGNSLLKILEEPPPSNLLILVGSAGESVLGTIVSRCQVIPFSPLPLDLAADIIRRQRPDLEGGGAEVLAALADGCPGQALALDAEGILPLYQQMLAALLAPNRSLPERVESLLLLAARMAELKEGVESLLALLRIFIKNAMAAATCPCCAAARPPAAIQARERWSLPQLSAKMAAIDLADQALARNCNRGLTCEVLLLELFDCGTP